MENIRHPNIVQYLGVTRDPESRLPVLLMELLDESLTKMLERSRTSLPYFIEVDICHDIALAVAYLHSNDIIHRDLSSNNVLILGERRAKVTDFGMSRISSAAPAMTLLTMCPGTQVYMSPEALKEPPTYTKKLDCFSEGVMMIQVCTRLWPEPGPRTKAERDPRSPTGMTEMPVLERERRQSHIDKINGKHGLLPIAIECLEYEEMKRPSSEELCERLGGLKETTQYRASMERIEREQNNVTELNREMRRVVQQLRGENERLLGEAQSKVERLQTLEEKSQQLTAQVQQLEEREVDLQSQNERLNRQLKEQEQITEEIQNTNHFLQRQVEQLQQQLSQQTGLNTKPPPPIAMKVKPPRPSPQQDQLQKPHPPLRKLMLGEWKDEEKAPVKMIRGAAVVDRNVAYFMNSDGQTYSYSKTWSELPECPYSYSSLAVIKGHLTAIGGRTTSGGEQNKLLSIVDKQWMECFPPMPTKRSYTAAVTTRCQLIVAGGHGGWNHLNTVEVMEIETRVWSKAASLPHPYSSASASICGGHLYMLGGDSRDGHRAKSVLTCSLRSLLQSRNKEISHSVWNSISNAPLSHSTCVAIDGELLAVGGEDERDEANSAVYMYESTSDSWKLISNMPTSRYRCLVAFLSTKEVMVVGGFTEYFFTDVVIMAKIHGPIR